MTTHALPPPAVARFREQGFVVAPALFGPDDLAKVDQAIAAITRDALVSGKFDHILELEPATSGGGGGAPVVRRIYNPFEQHESFRALATDARLLDAVESLLGPDLFLQHSKLNMKAARVGSVVEWHQDLTYFPHTNDDVLAALVYLDDATVENGCLQVLPGCHRCYFSHEAPDGSFAGMITEDLAAPAASGGGGGGGGGSGGAGVPRPVPIEAPAGSVIFMHCLTPHSSAPNRSARPRRTLIFEYRAADAFPIYYGEAVVKAESMTHLLRGKPARRARLAGPPPVIPVTNAQTRSLYELQELTRKSMDQSGAVQR